MEQHTYRHVVSLRYIILIPSKQSSPSLLNDASLENKQQTHKFYSHRFDLTAARTYNLAHTSRAR
jgi:hypothetical protein